MTIYKPGGVTSREKKEKSKPLTEDCEDDNPFAVDDDTINIVSLKRVQNDGANIRLMRSFVVCILLILIILSAVCSLYLFKTGTRDTGKPWIETCRVHYHQLKTGNPGDNRTLLMEGEYWQQVEIDVREERYEKLHIPPILGTRRAEVLHDMDSGNTAIIDRDSGRCFVTPLNTTLVKPISEFYPLVQSNKAGYYLPDAELVHDFYRVLKPQVGDVSKLGPKVFQFCEYYDTYRLVREDTAPDGDPVAVDQCYFKGEKFCLGNAGTKYLLIITISRCADEK
jgi:hypothetical protein